MRMILKDFETEIITQSSVRNLQTLKVDTNSYGSLLVPLMNETLLTAIVS